MRAITTQRGFVIVEHKEYGGDDYKRLIQESSAIGEYDHSLDVPGSSFLWVGSWHHLNREEVEELVGRMQHWLDTGRLEVDDARHPDELRLESTFRSWLIRMIRKITGVDRSIVADARRMRWMLNGNGYAMEELGLCGHGPCSKEEQDRARKAIDKEMSETG